MLPMIPIAIALAQEFLPSLVGKVAGDASGRVAEQVINTAAQVAGVNIGDGAGATAAAKVLRENPQLAVQLQTRLAEIEAQEVEAFLKDRRDARARDAEFVKSGRMNVRADAMVITAFVAVVAICLFLILAGQVSEGVLAFLTTIGGMMMKNISTAFDFEFGSSRGSKGKSDDMADILRALSGKGQA